jgi:hypothetical protein
MESRMVATVDVIGCLLKGGDAIAVRRMLLSDLGGILGGG